MSQSSPRVELPYLQPAQAQKHITHNVALQRLDAVTQLTVQGFANTAPPPLPAAGDIHGVGPGATGAWAGQEGTLAYWDGAGWLFLTPQDGWRAWGVTEQELRVWQDGDWQSPITRLQDLDMLGIGGAADDTNRLVVQADGALFSHAGAGHRLSLNKASVTETASVLFQSDWTGHAEMGLAGENAFALKLSPDGMGWQTALRADPVTEEITLSPGTTPRMILRNDTMQIDAPVTGSAVQANATDATVGKLLGVGAFGLGGGVPGISGNSIAEAQLETGFYHFVGSSLTDGPFSDGARGVLVCVKGHDGRRRFQAWRDSPNVTALDVWHGAQSSDGTGAIIWSAVLNQSTLLGTVSQFGGTPTGAVIERGTNANGQYTRFADGTQWCWRDAVLSADVPATTYSEVTWTFPATFIAAPQVIPNARSYNTTTSRMYAAQHLSAVGGFNNLATGVIGCWNKHSTAVAARIDGLAIGHWF